MTGAPHLGNVYLVGAGPGDPELLTVRALRLLQSADAILHDDLVPPEILRLASRSALIENVGKRCGAKSITQSQINSRMIEFARAGFHVVRLKSGDPLLFGRAGEELDALEQAGIECEVVPGITAATAAAAAAKIPLTDRRSSSQLVFLAGHRAGTQQIEVPRPGPSKKTVAVYMPADRYESLSAAFCAAGWRATTPCLIVSAASTPLQRTVHATLGTLAEVQQFPAPAILIVGEVAASRELSAAAQDFVSAGDPAAAVAPSFI
jgi:uroporphyrin-III C-methyltransferase